MSRRALLGFIVLNVLVTFAVTSGIILISESRRAITPTPVSRLLQVVITATLDPDYTPPVIIRIVTATPDNSIRILPTPEGGTLDPSGDIATLDPTLLPPSLDATAQVAANPTDPSGCPTYTLVAGDTAGGIAARYGVSLVDLMRVNELTESDLVTLQIGQVLVIPIQGCSLASTITPTPTDLPTATATPPATTTDAPTLSADQTQIEIVRVISAGDITAEGIEIRNISGGVIEIGGWTMTDKDGNSFTFPDYQMFEGRRVIVYTRGGDNTPFALFWGLPQAIWGDPTQVLVISDANGNLQARLSARDALNAPIVTPTP
ncbi:MAG: hypothetical protein OHK0023_05930 [Anaerolineae bacterium]